MLSRTRVARRRRSQDFFEDKGKELHIIKAFRDITDNDLDFMMEILDCGKKDIWVKTEELYYNIKNQEDCLFALESIGDCVCYFGGVDIRNITNSMKKVLIAKDWLEMDRLYGELVKETEGLFDILTKYVQKFQKLHKPGD